MTYNILFKAFENVVNTLETWITLVAFYMATGIFISYMLPKPYQILFLSVAFSMWLIQMGLNIVLIILRERGIVKMQNNWDLSLDLTLFSDEEEGIATLLEDIAGKIRKGVMQGDGNHCAGVYTFSIDEYDPSGEDDIQRTGPH